MKFKKIIAVLGVAAMLTSFSACDSKKNDYEKSTSERTNSSSDIKENSESDEKPDVSTDFVASTGLKFESNGDGTCSIVGLGGCSDADLVIPTVSPDGDTVTLIKEYAFMNLENVDSVTLINYNYEVDTGAFQYGKFKTLNITGGNPVFNKSAFSSCEDLTSISFSDCNIEAEEYSFYTCGKNADVSFTNCSGTLEKQAFQYSSISALDFTNCELELRKSTFSSCEDLTSISFSDCNIEAEEYAFYTCGDSATVEFTNCSVDLDDQVFQYSSIQALTITGSSIEIGKSAFSSCKDLTSVVIDGDSVTIEEYAFYTCEDLNSVKICDNEKSENNIVIDDRAFQYSKNLESVVIGNGVIELGKYVFSECADNLNISIAGKTYAADDVKEGLM